MKRSGHNKFHVYDQRHLDAPFLVSYKKTKLNNDKGFYFFVVVVLRRREGSGVSVLSRSVFKKRKVKG